MDAKTIAATVRTAIRKATKTPGDALHGLTVSVRVATSSQMWDIRILVTKGLDERDVRELASGSHTARAYEVGIRLHELAAPVVDWAAENDRMRFFTIGLADGNTLPTARPATPAVEVTDEEDAEHERLNDVERAELAEIDAVIALRPPRRFDVFQAAVTAMDSGSRPAVLAQLGEDETEALLEAAIIGRDDDYRDQVIARYTELRPDLGSRARVAADAFLARRASDDLARAVAAADEARVLAGHGIGSQPRPGGLLGPLPAGQRPTLAALPGGRAEALETAVEVLHAVAAEEPAAGRHPVAAASRSTLHVVTGDEAYVLEALAGNRGRVELKAAQIVTQAAMVDGYLADPVRMAQMLRDVVAEYEAGLPVG